MPRQVSWCGTHDELLRLAAIIGHNCACASHSTDRARPTCAAHRMLWQDQRAVNGLLFARHIAERLRREEFLAEPPPGEAKVDWFLMGRFRNLPGASATRRISMVPGVVLILVAIGLLCAEDAWCLYGMSRGCWIQPLVWGCGASTNASLMMGWLIVGLLLVVSGAVCWGWRTSPTGYRLENIRSPRRVPLSPTSDRSDLHTMGGSHRA